jgi:hypothetical protein
MKSALASSDNKPSIFNRRVVLAAFLCSPVLSIAKVGRTNSKASVELSTDFVLEIKHGANTVRLSADDIMSALKPPTRDILGRVIPEHPITY